MDINFAKPMTSIDGDIVRENDSDVLCGTFVINALLAQYKDESDVTGQEKIDRYQIAKKVSDSKKQDKKVKLESEDIVLIKKYLVKAGYGPLVYTRLDELLEGK